jgi:hypothetical protein
MMHVHAGSHLSIIPSAGGSAANQGGGSILARLAVLALAQSIAPAPSIVPVQLTDQPSRNDEVFSCPIHRLQFHLFMIESGKPVL